MNIKIEKKNLEEEAFSEAKRRCGDALDALWNTAWVRSSIGKTDRQCLEAVRSAADKATAESDAVLVLASGKTADLLKAGLSAVNLEGAETEIFLLGDTFSPAEYADVLRRLEGKKFSIAVIVLGQESLSLRGAYATFKQLLIRTHGKEQAAEWIFFAAGGSRFFEREAAEEDIPLFSCTDVSPDFAGNTPAVLLSLALAGLDISQYLNGFYDMLADPAWDLDAVDYAAAKVSAGLPETVLTWQRQLDAFGVWKNRGVKMPERRADRQELAFETLLLAEKDEQDIMMPFFEGCNEDGSLNLLLLEQVAEHFAENTDRPTVKISLETFSDYNLGQLFAFFQLSKGIEAFLLNQ